MGHRRYLPLSHKWRNETKSFDGTQEKRPPQKMCSGIEILDQVQDLEGLQLSIDRKKRKKISLENRNDNWNKKSIFFQLLYWKCLLLRHNLDVMHIEKNICENIMRTIINVKGKTKDTIKTRLDLQEMNIRSELHPIQNGKKFEVPTAFFTLSPEDKHKLRLFLSNLKVPDGFSSNISQYVNLKDHKIFRLKTHNFHVLLQHLLPLSLRGMLPKEVSELLIELSMFFSVLGSKEWKIDNLEHIEAQIPITLCKLEKLFPPSFFDVMEHLPVDLASEAQIARPIHYRWMYPVERWLYFLKSLIEDYDKKLRTHNCGVVVLGENDKDSENLDYYGVVTYVIEFPFVMDKRVVLFRCNWFDEIKGVKKDEYDFVSVNPARLLKTNDPFVLANQASQVFYANDNSNKGWQVAMKTQPRDSFEIVEQMDDDIVELGSPSKKKRKITNEEWKRCTKNAMTLEKENMKINIPSSACTNQVKQYTQEVKPSPGVIGKGLEKRSETAMSSERTRSNSTMSSSQEM
ncbi:hypothetical protein MTR67_051974 [Solanum verrucosum]|uniref:DUF4216 domain-containing protein n=1 Tax=Solanum verrucosum TaxID=315347 RepID=A0AAF0V7K2_SOLVR|nr:hypothetical protein MTR67_051974 [Solanum verrucosum]